VRDAAVIVYTVGHSSRAWRDFIALLKAHRIEALADIRRVPGSRKFPHFSREPLARALEAEGLSYRWFEALGGRRRGQPMAESPNSGLRNAGFRAYADYMRTPPFRSAVAELLALAEAQKTAVMCAEKLFWRCHRRLLSDYLVAHGVRVEHILERDGLRSHDLSGGIHIHSDGTVSYPAPPPRSPTLFDDLEA